MFSQYKEIGFNDISRIENQREICDYVSNIESWDKKLNKINNYLTGEKLENQLRSLHFELDVICNIIQSNIIERIVYEPIPNNLKGKNCDLLVDIGSKKYLVECKYFSPQNKKRPLDNNFFPKNFTVDLDEEVYYHDFTIRSKLIHILSEVESKVANYPDEFITVLAASTGFYFDWPRLMYVAYFYKHKSFHSFDYMAEMTFEYLKSKNIKYEGVIQEFWSCHQTMSFIDEMSKINTHQSKRDLLVL